MRVELQLVMSYPWLIHGLVDTDLSVDDVIDLVWEESV